MAKRSDGIRTRDRILKAAAEVFAQKGCHDAPAEAKLDMSTDQLIESRADRITRFSLAGSGPSAKIWRPAVPGEDRDTRLL